MGVYFTADMHFDDESIIRYEDRPFASVSLMNEKIIEAWNNTVCAEDEVYIVGDIGNAEYISKLNGRKYLIKGNHDRLDNEEYRRLGFAEVYDKPIIYDDFWIVSHEPMYVNRNMPYANIFAHVHNNPAYNTVSARSYCVSMDRNDFTPVAFEQITLKVALADEAENKAEKQN